MTIDEKKTNRIMFGTVTFGFILFVVAMSWIYDAETVVFLSSICLILGWVIAKLLLKFDPPTDE